MNTVISTQNIIKRYGNNLALDNISISISSGEVLVVMGPSGSGKSTFIRTLNGLETIDEGDINILGIPLNKVSNPRNVSLIRKRVGMVFQQFNLFPHLSILENITLAPVRVQNLSSKVAKAKALELLDQMGIIDQCHKYPNQLSGGQQQRVAIARALALEPEVMLFDEPTSALDPERIKEVLDAMKSLAYKGMTMIVVSHEIRFAREVADRILFMDKGKVIETSHPTEFFNNAKQERSRKFLNQIL